MCRDRTLDLGNLKGEFGNFTSIRIRINISPEDETLSHKDMISYFEDMVSWRITGQELRSV